ncbi:MAG: hypothetical protein MK290_01275 [Pedosphaera sp.]|jgi:hypothetical protein|nr:hypothetical protein [Pedosphaera sp.]
MKRIRRAYRAGGTEKTPNARDVDLRAWGLSVYCRRVRLALRLAALVIGCSGLILWLVGGLHMGWSKSTETRTEIDEVTGLEYPVTENKYVLGVELLGATLAVSGGLLGLSLAFRKPARPDKQPGAETSLTQL